jgi:hypothetical protein
MLIEPGGVFPAGRQQRDRRIVGSLPWGGREQGVQQRLRGPVHVIDRGRRLQLRQMLAQQPMVDDRECGARRHAQVVLEHQPVTGAVAHQVGAADVCAHRVAAQPPGRTKPRRPVQGLHADDPVCDDGLLRIDVAQERVQRPGPLPEALAELRPFVGGHHSRHEVDRKQLGAALAGNAERDVVSALFLLDPALPGTQRRHSQVGNGRKNLLVPRTEVAGGIDGFVVADVNMGCGALCIVAAGLVSEQQRRVVADGGCGARPATGGFGDQLVHHVGEATTLAQAPALPRR